MTFLEKVRGDIARRFYDLALFAFLFCAIRLNEVQGMRSLDLISLDTLKEDKKSSHPESRK